MGPEDTGNKAIVNVTMHRMNRIIFSGQFATIKFVCSSFQVEKGTVWLCFQVAATGPYDKGRSLAATGPYDKGWSFALCSMAVHCVRIADSHFSDMLFCSPSHWACAACLPRESDELDRLQWHLPLFG